MSMTLYMHPARNASRPVLLFAAENKIDLQHPFKAISAA